MFIQPANNPVTDADLNAGAWNFLYGLVSGLDPKEATPAKAMLEQVRHQVRDLRKQVKEFEAGAAVATSADFQIAKNLGVQLEGVIAGFDALKAAFEAADPPGELAVRMTDLTMDLTKAREQCAKLELPF